MTDRVITAKITRIGMRALFSATRTGLKLNLSKIAVGAGQYSPTGIETGLKTEKARVSIGGGEYLGDFEIMVSALFNEGELGWINEVGIFDDQNNLFAVWSEPNGPLAYKSAATPLVIGVTLAMTEIPPNSVQFTVGAPSVNITIAQPFSDMASAIIALQRRALSTDVDRFSDQISSLVAK